MTFVKALLNVFTTKAANNQIQTKFELPHPEAKRESAREKLLNHLEVKSRSRERRRSSCKCRWNWGNNGLRRSASVLPRFRTRNTRPRNIGETDFSLIRIAPDTWDTQSRTRVRVSNDMLDRLKYRKLKSKPGTRVLKEFTKFLLN